MKSEYRNRLVVFLIVLSVALAASLPFLNVLNYYFTDADTLTAIEMGRIGSVSDAGALLWNEQFRGVTFDGKDFESSFRPVASFTFGLDYYLWELNPFGYHLTDLLLHISVSILVFFLIRFLVGRDITAWLGATIFAMHPMIPELVSAPARRHEILVTLFVLASFLLFGRYTRSCRHRWVPLVLSLFCYLLALASKEIAVILPCLIFFYTLIYIEWEREPIFSRVVASLKTTLPYIVVTAVMYLWQRIALGGLGGYRIERMGVIEVTQRSSMILSNYFQYLFDAAGVEGLLFKDVSGALVQTAAILGALVLTLMLIISQRKQSDVIDPLHRFRLKPQLIAYACALIILAGIALMDVIANLGFFSEMVARWTFIPKLFWLLIIYLSLMLILKRGDVMEFIRSHSLAKVTLFTGIWLALPLIVYLYFGWLHHRYMYIVLIPFCILLSNYLVAGFGAVGSWIRELNKSPRQPRWNTLLEKAAAITLFFVLVLAASFLPLSTLADREDTTWTYNSRFTEMFFTRLEPIVNQLPDNSSLHIYNFPWSITGSGLKNMRHEEAYARDYSIKSWLNMKFPGNQMDVTMNMNDLQRVQGFPRDIELSVESNEDGSTNIYIRYVY